MFDYAAGKAEWTANGLPLEGTATRFPRAGDLAHADIPTCGLHATVERVRAIVENSGWSSCAVIDDDRVVLGRIRGSSLSEHAATETADRIMDPGPSTFRPNVPRQELLGYMRKHDLRTALITNADGTLVGMIRRDDLEPAALGG